MSEENAVLAMAGIDVSEETPAEPEPTEVETPALDAKGDIEPEPEKEPEAEPPAATEDAPKGVDPQYSAMLEKANDEKAKRQDEQAKREDLQRQFDEQKAQLDALQQKPAPDPLEDPEGFKAHQQDQITGLQDSFDQKLNQAKYDMARMTVMSLKEDYEEVEQIFIEEAKNNPALARQLGESANPALFAYEQGLRIKQLSVDPETLREQIRAEERAKIEAELKGKSEADEAKQAEVDNALKPSLATTGNAGLETEAVIGLDTIADATGSDALSRSRRR